MDTHEFEIVGEWGLGDVIGGIGSRIGQIAGRLADAVGGSAGIIDLTDKADKSVRHGMRPAAQVKALVLHQMACCRSRRNALTDYLKIGSHFAIMADGRILQLHPEAAMVWASNGFNHGSVAVEFAGNFPNTKGKWWQGDKYGRDQVTPAQLEAGRRLVRHLVAKIGLRTVLAHRQSSASRENDPGPDIWYHVGQWAVDTLKLSDGGPGFKVGDGNAIPELWRTWGRSAPSKEAEFGELGELESNGKTVVFGPLTATLNWIPQAYRYGDIIAKGSEFELYGGVYIAFQPPPPGGKIKILKVGMADTFARRIRNKEYKTMNAAHPGLSFYLARVYGQRDKYGVAGVVRMVEYALARLLRRAGELTGPPLPYVPSKTRGRVEITNVLPKQLRALLAPALKQSQSGGKRIDDKMPSGQLVLPENTRWEFEHLAPA